MIGHEPIVVVLPRAHPHAFQETIDRRAIDPAALVGHTDTRHVLRGIVERDFAARDIVMRPTRFLGSDATGISMVASTGAVTLLPADVEALRR